MQRQGSFGGQGHLQMYNNNNQQQQGGGQKSSQYNQQQQQQGSSSASPKRGIPIEIYFRGSDLLKADVLSDSDPYLVMYEIPLDAPQTSSDGWAAIRREVGRTEIIDNNLNPVWTKTILVRYIIGAS